MTNALEEIADLFAEIADMAERDQSLAPDAELLAHLIKRGLNPYDLIVGASAAALAEHLGRPAVDRQAYLHRITRAVAGMVTGGLRRPNGRPLRATEQRQLGELILSKWDGVLALVVEAVHRQQRKRSDRAAAMNTPLQGDAE
jgi:hypothetical protein